MEPLNPKAKPTKKEQRKSTTLWYVHFSRFQISTFKSCVTGNHSDLFLLFHLKRYILSSKKIYRIVKILLAVFGVTTKFIFHRLTSFRICFTTRTGGSPPDFAAFSYIGHDSLSFWLFFWLGQRNRLRNSPKVRSLCRA